ncbi:hypothetical protein CSW98_06065 [Vibrio sp. HA2012]|uniref:nitrous oxide-stimulated promoter family protein n=1 Tax=Vibrio sp. HA2012 TaxID=1971595 RepID=UPI000C2C6BB6|nr:nitrous oxide-stimulated promoter family protein [Vibrio sp. HA2012]PJC87457.1 hypothetical protein CSW98_06065 [Vibrio sp. HA2012]
MNDSKLLTGKLAIEYKTLKAMVQIYCKDTHNSARQLCPECDNLLSYAVTKLDRCPYGEEKPACNRCPIHCYKPEQKEKMRMVMRYSGPKMLLPHPILAVRHLLHARQSVPEKPKPNMSNRYRRMYEHQSDKK